MRWYRFLPFVLTAAGGFVLTGALRGPSRSHDNPPPAQLALANLAEAAPDPVATELVNRAVERLHPPHLEWLQAGVWLRARLPGVQFEGEGRYVLAPGQRFRLEMQTQRTHDKRRGSTTTLSVSNGQDLWLASRAGTASWGHVQRIRVGCILGNLESPVRLPDLRDQFLNGQALRGLVPLMHSLKRELHWLRRQGQAGEEVLTGTWAPNVAARLAPRNQPWPEGLPKVCRLVLRGPDLWPARIEWYGPPDARGMMPLLVEMEYRDRVLNQPIPEVQAAPLFSFEPGGAAVTDLTPMVMAGLNVSEDSN
jgi:hypothetical protein